MFTITVQLKQILVKHTVFGNKNSKLIQIRTTHTMDLFHFVAPSKNSKIAERSKSEDREAPVAPVRTLRKTSLPAHLANKKNSRFVILIFKPTPGSLLSLILLSTY